MFCKKCGNQLNEGAKFCAKCGNAVEQTQPTVEATPIVDESKPLCKNCGNELKEGMKFCAKCGTAVTVDEVVTESEPEVVDEIAVESVPEEMVEETVENETTAEPIVEEDPITEEVTQAVEEEVPTIEEEAPVIEESKPVCKNCGAELKEGVKFCVKCGAPVLMAETVFAETAAPIVEEGKPLCKNCGSELREGVKFCVKCGQPTDIAVTDFANPQFEPPIVTNGLSSSVAQLKKSLGSLVLVVMVVLYFLLAIGNIVNSFNVIDVDADNIVSIVAIDDVDTEDTEDTVEEFLELISPAAITSNLIASLPILLVATGLIITLVQVYRKDKFATTGFSFVKSAMIIRIVFASIGIVAAAAAIVVVPGIVDDFMYELAKEGIEDASGITDIVPLITMVSMGAAIVLQIASILHSTFALTTVNDMQKTVKTGEASSKKYNGIRIMNVVYIVLNSFSLLFAIAIAVFSNMVMDRIEDMFEAAEDFDTGALDGIIDTMETVLAPNVLNILLVALTIAILVVANIGISKHVKGKNKTLEFAQ